MTYSEIAIRAACRRAGLDIETIDRVVSHLSGGQPQTGQRIEVRDAALITIDGVTRTIAQWAHHTGTSEWTIRSRIRMGWDPVEAIQTPPRPYGTGQRRASGA